jgi:hypothetical protein
MEKFNLGMMIVIAFGIIIGLSLLTPISNNVNSLTSTQSVVNLTTTSGAINTPVTITGYQGVVGSYVIYNSSGTSIPNANMTLSSATVGGQKVLVLTTLVGPWNSTTVKINAALEPMGYLEDGASQTIALLIVIFASLGIAVFALYPIMKEKFF